MIEDNMRKRMHIYICLLYFAVQQKLTEYCKSTIIKKIFFKSHFSDFTEAYLFDSTFQNKLFNFFFFFIFLFWLPCGKRSSRQIWAELSLNLSHSWSNTVSLSHCAGPVLQDTLCATAGTQPVFSSFFFFPHFLGSYQRHMEVPKLEADSGAVAAGHSNSHSHVESKPRLWPIPQLTAMPDP